MSAFNMNLSEAKDLATIMGIVIGAGSLLFAGINLRASSRTNRAKFWLELRSAFTRHDDVHRALRAGGKWADSSGPGTADEYSQVEAYMGLFEHCEIMLLQGLLDEATFREIYRYRLVNLASNEKVREKLLCARPDWKRFIDLLARMQVSYERHRPKDA